MTLPVDPDAAWARAHAPDLPLGAMSDFEYDQHHFRRTRELQAEAAAEEQVMLRQLAELRQRLSRRIADSLRTMDEDRHAQAAELRKRYADARARAVEAAAEEEAEGGRGTGYGVEDTELEAKEEAERAAAAVEAEAAAKREKERADAEAARVAAAREEAILAETRRKMAELRLREADMRRNRMRERRAREDQAAWRQRAVNLEVANNIRYVDVPWPVSGTSSSTGITSPAAINGHIASITPAAVRAFLGGVAEIDMELQDLKDGVLPDTASASSSSRTEPDTLEGARRRAVRDAIRVFHPDKFYHRVLPRVRHAERGKVREGVERTSRVLNDILASPEFR